MSYSSRVQLDQVLPLVYEELRNVASRMMLNERAGHSFQTTELVHEAYVRLSKLEKIDWANEQHVLRVAVGVMRRVLIDYARKHNAKKRDPNQLFLVCPNHGFEEQVQATPNIDLLALDEALNHLREIDERKAEIVELRYFGGQNVESVAKLLEISTTTVKRDWALAKAWMYRELSDDSFQS
jgi:RNA polymerase sigma factor (TIGR02999 family)